MEVSYEELEEQFNTFGVEIKGNTLLEKCEWI